MLINCSHDIYAKLAKFSIYRVCIGLFKSHGFSCAVDTFIIKFLEGHDTAEE